MQNQMTHQNASHPPKTIIQEVIGVFLYNGHAVDPTMLTALSAIPSAQAKLTEDTMTRCKQFLTYAATHQDATITYKRSDMVLVVHSDASYLSVLHLGTSLEFDVKVIYHL